MKRAPRHVAIGSDGTLEGWRIVGFHGVVGESETPARCAPVYVDARGHLARLVGPLASVGGKRRIAVESAPRRLAEGPLPGQGTRIGPWPARLGDIVVVLGPRETRRASELGERARRLAVPERVQGVLDWMLGAEKAGHGLTCERRDGFVYWVCSEDEAWALFGIIAALVDDELRRAMGAGDAAERARLGWWMSRAARTDGEYLLALAALKSGGESDWIAFLRDLFPDRPQGEMRDEVARIEEELRGAPRWTHSAGGEPEWTAATVEHAAVLREAAPPPFPRVDPSQDPLRQARRRVRERFVCRGETSVHP